MSILLRIVFGGLFFTDGNLAIWYVFELHVDGFISADSWTDLLALHRLSQRLFIRESGKPVGRGIRPRRD